MIIASRILKLTLPSGITDVRIDIFGPEKNNGDWVCRYIVNWPDKPWASFAGGKDAVQALVSVLQKIGFELYASGASKAAQLSWDDWKGFGFPVPANARDLLVGDDAKFL